MGVALIEFGMEKRVIPTLNVELPFTVLAFASTE
jgi:hypothetical protein